MPRCAGWNPAFRLSHPAAGFFCVPVGCADAGVSTPPAAPFRQGIWQGVYSMEQQKLEKKYGLLTAIAMVVGIVIGSGVFFKAETVLNATGGNLPVGILAWLIGGMVMVICASMFSLIAVRYETSGGLMGYAEKVVGPRYAFDVGWYLTTVYNPALTAVLAWVSARYTCVLIGWSITGGECMTLAGFYLMLSYAMNILAPILAGRFQITTTAAKLIPLFAMGIVGTAVGLMNGTTLENFTTVVNPDLEGNPLFAAVVATIFAYDGWIVATSINAELRNAKRNMPLALIFGSVLIVVAYILYYVGLSGAVPNQVLMENGEQGALIAFDTLFGAMGGNILFVFVIISCMGTLNGLMMGCVRNLYALSERGMGPRPEVFSQVDPVTNMPHSSGVFALVISAFWLTFFYGANLGNHWFGPVAFDSSELSIVALYFFYIPIFLFFMKRGKGLPVWQRWLLPLLALGCCVLVLIAAWFAHGGAAIGWFVLFVLFFFLLGRFFEGQNRRRARISSRSNPH